MPSWEEQQDVRWDETATSVLDDKEAQVVVEVLAHCCNKGAYHGDFRDRADVLDAFSVPEADREGVVIVTANYTQEAYEGSADVIFLKEGKIFEVVGGHCSCFGLENQWDPVEVSWSYLASEKFGGRAPKWLKVLLERLLTDA